jgi:DNA end-binding protein Ku
MLHTMYFADEIRDFGDVEKGDSAVKPAELDLAKRLIQDLTTDEFKPEKFSDEYRDRVKAVVEQKIEGREVTTLAPQAQKTQVIDLMDALKQSLGKRADGGDTAREKSDTALAKKPAARARAKAEPAPKARKVAGKR